MPQSWASRIEVEEDAIPFGENEGPGTTAQRSGHVTRRREVLKLLQSEPVCTARQIGTHVGVNLRTAHRYVHELREQGHTIAGRRGEGFVYERKG